MTTSFFEGVGGLKIATTSWRPAGQPRAVMVLIHGFNAHSGYMAWPAEQFAARGLAAYALDLRGRGKSEGERFYVEEFSDYLTDVNTLVSQARSENPGLPVYVLGHSAGGVIASSYVFEHQDQIAGLVCESFAFDVGLPHLVQLALQGRELPRTAPARVLAQQQGLLTRSERCGAHEQRPVDRQGIAAGRNGV